MHYIIRIKVLEAPKTLGKHKNNGLVLCNVMKKKSFQEICHTLRADHKFYLYSETPPHFLRRGGLFCRSLIFQRLPVRVQIIRQSLQIVLEIQYDLHSFAFIDSDLMNQLRQHGTGQFGEIVILAEVGEKFVFLLRIFGALICGLAKLGNGAVQRVEPCLQVGFQSQVFLLGQQTALPVRVQAHHHPVAL